MNATTVWERSFPARPESVAVARTAVARLAEELGAPDPPVSEIRLAVSEACANAVMHGYVGTEPDTFRVLVDRVEGEIRIRVRDHGRGMRPRADSPGAGLGLPIIAQVAASVEVRTPPDGPGTELCMTFALTA